MQIAIDKKTGKEVEAEQLWEMDTVDPEGYICMGCDVKAIPCSYLPENKPRPYFRAKHIAGCDIPEKDNPQLKTARTKSITEKGEDFPLRYPNKLTLETRDNTEPTSTGGKPINPQIGSSTKNGATSSSNNKRYSASSIRPICRTFLDFPYDRANLGITIPNIEGTRYHHIFKKIKQNEIIYYPDLKLFYAEPSWHNAVENEQYFEITLYAGNFADNKLIEPYKVRLNWRDWSQRRKNSLKREFQAVKEQSKENKQQKAKEKSLIFFIGQQDQQNPSFFTLDNYSLICFLTGELIFPTFLKNNKD